MAELSALKDMIKIAIEGGLRITEIIQEPDGTARLLTEPQEINVSIDPLEEARKRRETKGKRYANGH